MEHRWSASNLPNKYKGREREVYEDFMESTCLDHRKCTVYAFILLTSQSKLIKTTTTTKVTVYAV